MDKYPKTCFIQTRQTEIERVMHAARQTFSGFYPKKRFWVLPRLAAGNNRVVYLPDLGIRAGDGLGKEIVKIPLNFPIVAPRKLIEEMAIGIKDSAVINDKLLRKRMGEWEAVGQRFFDLVCRFAPKTINLVEEIEVRLTKFGSISSYQYLKRLGGQKYICYLREDGDIGQLAEAILTGLVWRENQEKFYSWEDLEAIVDYLLTRPAFKSLFPKYRPTLENLYIGDERLEKEARDYVARLGVVNNWTETKDKVCGRLTSVQAKIFKKMVEVPGKIFTADEIGEIAFGEKDFSLWAVNKAMQRLKNRLVGLGMAPNCLTVLRGRGYLLDSGVV